MVKNVKKIKPAKDEEELEEKIEDIKEETEEEDAPRITSKDEVIESKNEDIDYIRQYQFKIVNNQPTLGGKLTDPDKGSRAETMKAALLKQRKISILIPLEPGSSPKIPYSVTLNGYRLDLPVQQYIDVPEQVAERIREANNQTVAALNRNRIEGDSNKENALG